MPWRQCVQHLPRRRGSSAREGPAHLSSLLRQCEADDVVSASGNATVAPGKREAEKHSSYEKNRKVRCESDDQVGYDLDHREPQQQIAPIEPAREDGDENASEEGDDSVAVKA